MASTIIEPTPATGLPQAPTPPWSGVALLRSATSAARRVSIEARSVWVAVAAFVGVSAWWLTQDARVPDWDSGFHEFYAAVVHDELARGALTRPFTDYNSYPPLVHLIGALSVFVTGLHPMALILSANLAFVPLLAFGCFGAGRIVYGPRGGALAAVLALGSPMVVSTMHEYYLDAPQAAIVAVAVWTLLASRRFERIGLAAGAGALSGLALLTKETSVIFLAGPVAASALLACRGGRRGALAFAVAACVVAGPWYVDHAAQVSTTLATIGDLDYNRVQSPPRFSLDSLSWYWWNLVNQQLLLPFTLAFLVGVVAAVRRLWRRRARPGEAELLCGVLVSYAGMTLLLHKDPRYTLPMLVYVAVLATGWIAALPRGRLRAAAAAAVVALAAVYLVGVSAGVGGAVRIALPGARDTIIYSDQLTVYESAGWLRGAPLDDGNVQALLSALRGEGIRDVLPFTGSDPPDFNEAGLRVMAMAAGLSVGDAGAFPTREQASLVRSFPARGGPSPCRRLRDGSAVYVVRGVPVGLDPATMRDPGDPAARYTLICPGRAPLQVP